PPPLIFPSPQPMIALRITMVAILVNLAAGVALIGPLGIDGAAIAVLAAIVASPVTRRYSLRSRFGVRIPLGYSAAPVLAAAASLAAAAVALRVLAPASDLLVDGVALGVA